MAAADEPLEPALLDHDLLPRWDEEWLEVEREGFRQRRLHALESSSRTLREQGPALLFEKPTRGRMPLLLNAFGTHRRMAKALGVDDLDDYCAFVRGETDLKLGI